MTGEIIEEIIDHNWKFFILVFQNSNGNCDLHNMSNLQNNTDSLGAKIDKAKIPNGWKILFERISSTLYIFFWILPFRRPVDFCFHITQNDFTMS